MVAPLASFTAQRLVILPAQSLRRGESLGWSAGLGDERAYLAAVDTAIAAALGERRLRSSWVFPPDLARSARRNVGFVIDPYQFAYHSLRAAERRLDDPIPEPAGSQLRAMVALHDARYAFVPLEVRFDGVQGNGRAVLHLVLVDARTARIVWFGDVASDPSDRFSPALAAGIGNRVADLFVAP